MSKYKNDILLIAAIILCAGLVFLGILIFRKPGAYVCVRVDDTEVLRMPLDTDYYRESIECGSGHYNVIEIREGSVSVTEASCPDKVCIHQGRISTAGQNIICLPNRLIVTIEGGDTAHQPDAVAE